MVEKHIELSRAEIIEEVYTEKFQVKPVEEFFPLDFQARFPEFIWKDFFISHDFVYTSRHWVPFSNDASGIRACYECRQCNCRISEIIDENQCTPEEEQSSGLDSPDDYFAASEYRSYLFGAQDLGPYTDSKGFILGDRLPRIMPDNIWPCPHSDPNRVIKKVEPVGDSFDPNAWIDFWLEEDEAQFNDD